MSVVVSIVLFLRFLVLILVLVLLFVLSVFVTGVLVGGVMAAPHVLIVLVVLCLFLVLVGNPKEKYVCGCYDCLSPCPIPYPDCFCLVCPR